MGGLVVVEEGHDRDEDACVNDDHIFVIFEGLYGSRDYQTI